MALVDRAIDEQSTNDYEEIAKSLIRSSNSFDQEFVQKELSDLQATFETEGLSNMLKNKATKLRNMLRKVQKQQLKLKKKATYDEDEPMTEDELSQLKQQIDEVNVFMREHLGCNQRKQSAEEEQKVAQEPDRPVRPVR
jgi:hypothetical protein